MGNQIVIGMAEMKVTTPPNSIITYGLGSCVGLVLYDKIKKISGMVHIVIPMHNKTLTSLNPAKFASTAPVALYNSLIRSGATKGNIVAKLAGGAHVFKGNYDSEIFKVGERNVAITKECLRRMNVPVVAEDILGSNGRTVEFFSDTLQYKIKTIGKGEKMI